MYLILGHFDCYPYVLIDLYSTATNTDPSGFPDHGTCLGAQVKFLTEEI